MVQREWAQLIAISLLSTLLGKLEIIRQPPVNLNLYILIIGISGTRKSLPLKHILEIIFKKIAEKTGIDFKLPTKSSVEGFIQYMNENKLSEGIIIAHEFSGVFKKARGTGYQADAMEFMSENYDGISYKRSTISHGQQNIENIYVGIIAATTPYFLKKVDEDFFVQGTGNRFIYNYYDINEVPLPSDKEEDIEKDVQRIFSQQGHADYKEKLEQYADELGQLYEKLSGPQPLLTDLRVTEKAAIKWRIFEIRALKKWKEFMQDAFNWKGQIINRYPLTVLKLAGIYCISRNYETILQATTKEDLEHVKINEEDMKLAIKTVMRHHKHFKKLLELREQIKAEQAPVRSHEDKARTALIALKEFPNNMAFRDQLFERQTVTSSPNEFGKYIALGLVKGWIQTIDKTTIKDPEEKKRLKTNTRAIVYQWVK